MPSSSGVVVGVVVVVVELAVVVVETLAPLLACEKFHLSYLRDEDIRYCGFRRELKTFCFNVAPGAQ